MGTTFTHGTIHQWIDLSLDWFRQTTTATSVSHIHTQNETIL